MSPIELAAALLGLVNIVLIALRRSSNYPFGIAMVTLYAVVFYRAQLYSAALLQLFFLAAQGYGWWYWRRSGTGAAPVPVRPLGPRDRWLALSAGTLVTVALGYGMARWTDAAAPWLDAANAAWSMVAQILTDRRHVESWPLWIAIDLLSIILYAGQGLVVTSLLYVVLLILAIWGWMEWRRAIRTA